MDVFVGTKQTKNILGVSTSTLRKWDSENKIETKRTIGNHRVYNVASYIDKETRKDEDDTRQSIIYIRVSSAKQKDDLERQRLFMESKFSGYRTIKDIGSGLNFKRKGLLKLLEQCKKGEIKRVVVSSKDRLCRFGFDLFEWFFKQENVELLVLDKTDKSPEQEFTEDILSVLQVFSCRWNGKRKYTVENKKNQIEVNIDTKENVKEVE